MWIMIKMYHGQVGRHTRTDESQSAIIILTMVFFEFLVSVLVVKCQVMMILTNSSSLEKVCLGADMSGVLCNPIASGNCTFSLVVNNDSFAGQVLDQHSLFLSLKLATKFSVSLSPQRIHSE